MRTKKENLSLCLWAVAVILVIPLIISVIPKGNTTDENSFNSETGSTAPNTYNDGEFTDSLITQEISGIRIADLSGNDFANSTKYKVDPSELHFTNSPIEKDKPTVLIIHTYGTQAYSTEDYITGTSTFKSENEEVNVICVGETLANELESKGIKTIHDKTMYDKISYSKAYILSIESIREYMIKYPSIKYVIDIQRDSLFSQNGSCIKSLTETDKGNSAQISFISGSDENGADFPNWKNNLSFSYALSEKLKETNPKLSRGVSLMPSGYGQYVCEGFITVEIGTSGNTPEEAKTAAIFLAKAFSETVL